MLPANAGAIRLLGDCPTWLGRKIDRRSCAIDFLGPVTGQFVCYSNLKWGRTHSDRRSQTTALNRLALANR